MSLIPCPNKVGCDTDFPLTNFSSEDPDPRSFLGYSTGTAPTSAFTGGGGAGPRGGNGPDSNDTGDGVSSQSTGTGGDPPPLGSEYDNPSVTTFSESEESQDQANADAGNDNVSALAGDSTTGAPGGGYKIPPRFTAPGVFTNTEQSCTVDCSDGGSFTYTVPAGRFRAFSVAQANAAANAYACRQAALNRLCLSGIDGSACTEQAFSQTITADSANIPIDFIVTSGSIPAWVDVEVGENTVHMHGTPQIGDVGDSTFTITAVDSLGFSASRSYTISVSECIGCVITSVSPLPEFDQGQPYTYGLSASGTSGAVTWTLISGSLPTGLSLSTAGVISGTVSLNVGTLDATFTVRVTDEHANTCTKTFLLPVLDYHNYPPGKKWRIQGYADGVLNASCCQVCVSCNVWDGKFSTQAGSADFTDNGTNGITNHVTGQHLVLGPSNQWTIRILCITIPANGVWTGIKIGSNAGAKLDSPAGVYDFSNYLGDTLCDSTAQLVIEEY